MTVSVTIPMTLPSVANLRLHWAKKARLVKAQRSATRLAMSARGFHGNGDVGVWGRLHGGILFEGVLVVTLTRIAPRALDSDNLASAFKAVRDEVAAYFGVNDNDPRVEWRYRQEKGKPACVRIAFEATT